MTALLMSLCINAQTVNFAAGERLAGAYITDEYDSNGFGINGAKAQEVIAAQVIPTQSLAKMTGAKLKAVRFALTKACDIKSVYLYTKKGTYAPEIITTIPVEKYCNAGWTRIDLPTAMDMPTDGSNLMIGYSYQEGTTYGVMSIIPSIVVKGQSWLYADLGTGQRWSEISDYGALSIQAIVDCSDATPYDVVLGKYGLESLYGMANNDIAYEFEAYNFGREEAKNVVLGIYIDEKEVAEKSLELIGYQPVTYTGVIKLPADLERGKHEVALMVKSINGHNPTDGMEDDAVFDSFTSYKDRDLVPRQKHLVEEMTSNTCTNCYLGVDIMHELLNQRKDVIVSCIHGNMSGKDPFNTGEATSMLSILNCTEFPKGSLNRTYINGSISMGLGYTQTAQIAGFLSQQLDLYSQPSLVSINIDKRIENDMIYVTVSGEGGDEAKELLKDYTVTCYLIEDSLVARQLVKGNYVQGYVHNHVFRKCISWKYGDDINWTSNSAFRNEMSVDIDETWNLDRMTVVAFVSGNPTPKTINGVMTYNDMGSAVTNAECTPLVTNADGISEVKSEKLRVKNLSYYNLNGQRISHTTRGLFIHNGKKYLK